MLILALLAFMLVGCASHRGSVRGGKGQIPSLTSTASPRLGDGIWISSDGAQFPYTRWGPDSAPETVVVAIHGLSGAASDFDPLGDYLSKRSTAVYSYALRGQGNDPDKRRLGDIMTPTLWYADLDTFLTLVRAESPNARLFLYGESLGGLISVHGLENLSAENRRSIRGLIFASPVVSLKDLEKLSRLKYAALMTVIRLLPRRMISIERLASGKDDMKITRDTDHRENLRNTPHAVGAYSFRLLGTIQRLIRGSWSTASMITKPILVLYPGHDLLTTAEDVEDWYSGLRTKDKEKYRFEESYHLLLHDKDWEEVVARVGDWLERH